MDLETILDSTSGLIKGIIKKYIDYYEYDDLYQVASIGVINAYKNYKKDSNVRFSTYAYTYILGEVVRYARENRGIKCSYEYSALGKKIDEARNILTQKLMKEPSTLELANFLELPVNLIDDINLSRSKLDSLDRVINDDGKELTLLDTVMNSQNNIPTEDEIMLKSAINNLKEPDRSIISMTYFKDYTQDMIADNLGMSQVQVSRNLSKSKKVLRKILEPVR